MSEKKYNNFTICYGVGKVLGLNLVDYKPEKLQWFRFAKGNKTTLMKFLNKQESTISYSKDLETADRLIIVLCNKLDDQLCLECKIYEINLGNDSFKSIKYSKEKDNYYLVSSEGTSQKPIISKQPYSKKIATIDPKTVSRYEAIMKRNYLQRLNYILFTICSSNMQAYDTKENYDKFFDVEYEIPCEIKKSYKDMYSAMTQIRVRNECFKVLNEKFIELKINEKFKENYYEYYQTNILTFEEFSEFWNKVPERVCGYCGISESQIVLLDKADKIKTKRFYSRGKTMEVDKICAFGEYKKDNIILSCYWCNNAKTDEYSLKEFEPIAKGINAVWNSRFSDEKVEFPSSTYTKLTKQRKECD